MIRIPISDIAIAIARQKQEKMDELYAEKKGNYVDLYNDDRWYHGTLGELVFRDALDQYGIDNVYDAEDSVGADNGDFTVYYQSKPLSVDVKASNGSYTKMLLVPNAQLFKHSRDLYVGVRLIQDPNDKTKHIAGEVMGYLWERELEPIQHPALKVSNHGDYYENIHPIEDMFNELRKR